MPPYKSELNLPLKTAIWRSGHRQRAVAAAVGIPETRLSEIVNQRGTPPSDDEKASLALFLGEPVEVLFVPEPTGAQP